MYLSAQTIAAMAGEHRVHFVNPAAKRVNKSLGDAAKGMHVTRSTAKSHLDAVFAKTGCRRQAQLVHLMGCLRGLA